MAKKKTTRKDKVENSKVDLKEILGDILSQYSKSEIVRKDLEYAKANYIQTPNDENLSKLTKIRSTIQNMSNTKNIARNTKDEMVSDFDKWYEANKNRLHKKNK